MDLRYYACMALYITFTNHHRRQVHDGALTERVQQHEPQRDGGPRGRSEQARA